MLDLRRYESAKFELAEILRAIVTASPDTSGELRAEVAQLFARLAEDKFNLLTIGRFSRGKTTLMNAILGSDRLPTGILPLTSVITKVTYGSRERAQVQFQQSSLLFDVPLEALPDYITERGNPANMREVRAAIVALPAEILRRGVCFVDSPGLGSAVVANTRTTQAYLPQADAALLVSGYDGPLCEEELRVAHALAESERRLFVVLNKRDTATPQMREEVEGYVRRQLGVSFVGAPPPVFCVSARDGLAARLAGSVRGFAESGMGALERALFRFLLEDKHRELLHSISLRAGRLVDRFVESPQSARLHARLEQHCDRHGCERPNPAATPTPYTASDVGPVAPLRNEECAICSVVRDALFNFLSKYQYDLVVREEERQRFASAGGLCGQHFWFYGLLSADRDMCLALTPLAKRVTATLHAAAEAANVKKVLEDSLPVCAACAVQRHVEARAITKLITSYRAADAIELPPPLCLPHLRQVGELADPEVIRVLAQRQASGLAQLADDMQRYVIKRDGVRRGLATDEEEQAAHRTIALLVGHRKIAKPGARR